MASTTNEHPGNCYVQTIDWNKANLLHGDAYTATRGLPLLQMGRAPIVALVIQTTDTIDGRGKASAIIAPPIRNPNGGVAVASALYIDKSHQRKTRSEWSWRWWPGDWNSIFFKVQVMQTIGGDPATAIRQSTISYQGSPLKDEPKIANPMAWPLIPGTTYETAAYPSDAAEDQPISQYLRITHPAVPPYNPASDDLAAVVLQPLESVGSAFPWVTVPLPLPDYMGYFRAFARPNGYRLRISGPPRSSA